MLTPNQFSFYFRLALLSGFTVLAFSCGSGNGSSGGDNTADASVSFSDSLRSYLGSVQVAAANRPRPLGEDMRLVYTRNNFKSLWFNNDLRPNDAAASLIADLTRMTWDGADTAVYDLHYLNATRIHLDTSLHNTLSEVIAFDTSLTRCYLHAAAFLLLGDVNPRKVDSLWFHVNDTVWMAPEILAACRGGYPSLDTFRSKWPTYRLAQKAYKMYSDLKRDTSYLNAVFNMQQQGQDKSVLRISADYIMQSELPWLHPVANDSVSEREQLIRGYQVSKGLRPTGQTDEETYASMAEEPDAYMLRLKANMERIRWMPQQPGSTYVVVDVPLMELFVRKSGQNVLHKRVVVGKKSRQTPSLWANMTNIVINPPWGVPPTILKKDVLPGIQGSGQDYLNRKGLRVYDREGKPVSVASINSRNYKRFVYRQAPGVHNALGEVKFNMPNKWDIYLHDTPHRSDFGRRDRALSSGCVRVHDPRELAVYILSQLEGRESFTEGLLDTLVKRRRTRSESLKNKIPVFITYLTVFEDSTGRQLRFVKDVYGRDEKLLTSLR